MGISETDNISPNNGLRQIEEERQRAEQNIQIGSLVIIIIFFLAIVMYNWDNKKIEARENQEEFKAVKWISY